MSPAFPVAFYAPMKPPDHPVPSGDRTMARLMLRLIQAAGAAPELASALRVHDAAGSGAAMAQAMRRGAGEARRLIADYAARPPGRRPALWFTYHVYYKAPDLIGPEVARALAIPYVVAEGSRSPRRAQGAWRDGHRLAEAALDAADLILVLNPRDRPALMAAQPPRQRLADLPPFIDTGEWPEPPRPAPSAGPVRLLTVAMMRDGDKLASYRLLAEALAGLPGEGWHLDIAGDGPARGAVTQCFAGFGDRVTFHGLVEDRPSLAGLYAAADLFVWPAVNEAFGMVFLEAALQGCPAVAGAFGGVAGVVRAGETGVLTEPGDAPAFAAAVAALIGDAAERRRLGEAARRFVRAERSLASAAALLAAAWAGLLRQESL